MNKIYINMNKQIFKEPSSFWPEDQHVNHCTKLEAGKRIQCEANMLPYYFVFTFSQIINTIFVPVWWSC